MAGVKIEEELSIRTIATQYDLIRTAFGAAGDVVLDCSGVRHADLTGVQLLVSATKTAAGEGRMVRISYPPSCLSQALSRAGIDFVPSADGLHLT